MARKRRVTNLPAPFLKRITLLEDGMDRTSYPMNLSFLDEEFELGFTQPVTIIVGENGTGKSTLIEGIAALAGYDEAGGGKGYRPVDHSDAMDVSGAGLAEVMRGGWLPKVTDGWFFKAESFFSVARFLDETARLYGGTPPDFLSHSHGEGFLRFFDERIHRRGIYFMDEPESALSPSRQKELLRLLAGVQSRANAQIIMATHSPILMAVPGAQLLEVSPGGVTDIDYRETRHFRMYREFVLDPDEFVREALAENA